MHRQTNISPGANKLPLTCSLLAWVAQIWKHFQGLGITLPNWIPNHRVKSQITALSTSHEAALMSTSLASSIKWAGCIALGGCGRAAITLSLPPTNSITQQPR